MSNASDLGSLGMPVAGLTALDLGGLLRPDLGTPVGVVVFAAAIVVGLALIAGLALVVRVTFVRLFRVESRSPEPVWLRGAVDLTSAPTDPGLASNRSTWLRHPARKLALTIETEGPTP